MIFNWNILCARLLSMYCLIGLGCQDPASLQLIWSIRKGLVGEWQIHGKEIFTVGRYLGVYDVMTGKELRRLKLPRDYGDATLGEIGLPVMSGSSDLVFGWYDFDSEKGKVVVYDANALSVRWERDFDWRWDLRETRPTFALIIAGSYLYALALGKKGPNLFKLRLSNGEIIWSKTIEKYAKGIPPALHNDKLLVRSIVSSSHPNQFGYFQAIDTETGETVWRIHIDGISLFDDPLLISGSRAYLTSAAVLSNPDHLYVIDLSRGTIIHHERVRQLRAPFFEHLGILYFGGDNPAAFDINSKKVIWQTDLAGTGGSAPAIGANGVLDLSREEIYIGDSTRNLYVLSSTTGQVKDKIDIRSYWRGDVLFNPIKAFFGSYGVKRLELNQGLLLVGTVDSSLFVFRPTTKK